MKYCVPHPFSPWLRLAACLALLSAVAACGSSHSSRHAAVPRSPSRYYPPPGPHNDPWGPYIHEASARFGMPEQWIRSVMHQESGEQEDVISWAGAIGLMQVMPDTYAELRDRYKLGSDPFDPHNNILAGTAYLREMYDRFGSPGFLAAYNAGPNRVDKYVNHGTPLPAETVNYVAAIAPHLGVGSPMSGPLSVYGGRGVELASGGFRETAPVHRAATSSGCDLDAAYDPDEPCKTPSAVQVALAPPQPMPVQTAMVDRLPLPAPMAPTPVVQAGLAPSVQSALARIGSSSISHSELGSRYTPYRVTTATRYAHAAPPIAAKASQPEVPCDPDAAYNPKRHCVYEARPYMQVALRTEPAEPVSSSTYHPGGMTAASASGRWGIQVGAYSTLPGAQSAAERARAAVPDLLRKANVELPPTAPLGSKVAFRARLTGLPQHVAADACAKLTAHGMPCMTLPPERT